MFLSPRKIGSVLLMLVLAHLFTPAAHALPPSGSLTFLESESFIPAAWEWLVSRVSPGAGSKRIWEKAGSSMEPNGHLEDSALNNHKAGSSMDPDGNK